MMALKCSWPIKNKLLPVQNCTVVVCRYFQGWSSDTKASSFRFMPAQAVFRPVLPTLRVPPREVIIRMSPALLVEQKFRTAPPEIPSRD